MTISHSEKKYLRELAEKYCEIANNDVQEECRRRFRDTNDLKHVRPPVLIDEIPWHEMDIDGELQLIIDDPAGRNIEWFLKKNLYLDKHLKCDTVFDKYFPVMKAFEYTGNGLDYNADIISTDSKNHIVSHSYKDCLKNEDDLEKMKLTEVFAFPEKDEINLSFTNDILHDILPVRLCGHGIYYAPWDDIPRYHGVENSLMDMYDRPDFVHKIIKKFTENFEYYMTQMENLGLWDAEGLTVHCTPAIVGGVPADDYEVGDYRLKDIWFRSMAQLFGAVSPEMHYEFDLQYSLPLMEKCAYTYYGCCEPLDNKIDMLRKIKNLRKIGVSPWADVTRCAEQIRGDYVLSNKPNPANVAIQTDPDVIRAEIRKTAEAAVKHGCPCDIVLKDISTVSYKPQNLIVWANIVSDVLDEYYN